MKKILILLGLIMSMAAVVSAGTLDDPSEVLRYAGTRVCLDDGVCTSYLTTEVDGSTTNELQNLWDNLTADQGSVTANSKTDTLSIVGNSSASTHISGDTLTITCVDTDTTYTENSAYLSLTGTVFGFIESTLNSTIDARDSDTLFTNGTGITLVGNEFNLSSSYLDANYVGQNEYPNLDTDSTDDFDGAWSSLTGIPSGFSDNIDNDTTYENVSQFTNDRGYYNSESNLTAVLNDNYVDVTGDSMTGNLVNTKNITASFFFGFLNWSYLVNVPSYLTDGDNDTLFTNGSGIGITGNQFYILLGFKLPQGCSDGNIAAYNITSGGWDCSSAGSSTDDQTLSYNSNSNSLTIETGNTVNLNNYTESSDYLALNTTTRDFIFVESKLNSTIDARDTDTQLTQEQVEDYAGGMVDGTETLINVVYDDPNGNFNFTVDNNLSKYDNSESGFLTSYSETDPSWAANSSTVARIGDCAVGTVMQNTTIGGVECVTDANTQNSEATTEGMIFDNDNTGTLNTTGNVAFGIQGIITHNSTCMILKSPDSGTVLSICN